MTKVLLFLIVAVFTFGIVGMANASLIVRGTDSLGNQLIYDDDLDITWYDYTHSVHSWPGQSNWALSLTVEYGGSVYDDWSLPTNADGPWVTGYDGTTTAGYNITDSSMLGHLFYAELGNSGKYDIYGNEVAEGEYGLLNTGDFLNLRNVNYWTGTNYAAGWWQEEFWYMNFSTGNQSVTYYEQYAYGIAMRYGDVPVVPIPSAAWLLGSGLIGLVGFRKKFRKG